MVALQESRKDLMLALPPHKNDTAELVNPGVLSQLLRATLGTSRLQIRLLGSRQHPHVHSSGKREGRDSWMM